MKYRVACYIRIDPDEEELYDTMEEARNVYDHCVLLQPENIYQVEAVEESIDSKEY